MTERCQHHAGAVRCIRETGHGGGHIYRCAGKYCPGLGWPASNTPHPTSCAIKGLNSLDKLAFLKGMPNIYPWWNP